MSATTAVSPTWPLPRAARRFRSASPTPTTRRGWDMACPGGSPISTRTRCSRSCAGTSSYRSRPGGRWARRCPRSANRSAVESVRNGRKHQRATARALSTYPIRAKRFRPPRPWKQRARAHALARDVPRLRPRPPRSASGADRRRDLLDLVDLPLTVLDEIVIALHHVLHLPGVGLAHPGARHHVVEGLHVLDLELHDRGPVALPDVVGQDSELPLPRLLHELRHGERLLDHWPDLAGLAIHDLANEQHASLLLLVHLELPPIRGRSSGNGRRWQLLIAPRPCYAWTSRSGR